MNHVVAIAFAAIGVAIGFAAGADAWYIPLFGGVGLLAGYFLYGLFNAPGNRMRLAFRNLGTLRGLRLEEIESRVGPCSERVPCHITDRGDAPGTLCTWREGYYRVTLLFDGAGVCIGVTEESMS